MQIPDTINFKGSVFRVLRLLGKGKGGYSYLVSDGNTCYCLKQIHHEPCSYYTFGNKMQAEIADYDRLNKAGIPMPLLLDYDLEHEQILKQYIDGPTVFDLVLEERLPQIAVHQLHAMCKVLYAAGLNIDYFPTNFILENGKLFYVDYECNQYMQQWDFEHWGCIYWEKSEAFMEYVKNTADK